MRKRDGDHRTVRAAGVTAGTETRPRRGSALAEDLPEAEPSSSSPSEPGRHHARPVSSEALPHEGLSPAWKEGGGRELVLRLCPAVSPDGLLDVARGDGAGCGVWSGGPQGGRCEGQGALLHGRSFLLGHHPHRDQDGRAFSQGTLGESVAVRGSSVCAQGPEADRQRPSYPLRLSRRLWLGKRELSSASSN